MSENKSSDFAVAVEVCTTSSLMITIFFLYLFGFTNQNFSTALFTIASAPVMYALKYYTKRGKTLLDDIVAIIFAYFFALVFYFILTQNMDFIIVFYALIVFLILRTMIVVTLSIFDSINIEAEHPLIILITSFMCSFIVSVFVTVFFI